VSAAPWWPERKPVKPFDSFIKTTGLKTATHDDLTAGIRTKCTWRFIYCFGLVTRVRKKKRKTKRQMELGRSRLTLSGVPPREPNASGEQHPGLKKLFALFLSLFSWSSCACVMRAVNHIEVWWRNPDGARTHTRTCAHGFHSYTDALRLFLDDIDQSEDIYF